ncbi:helix-turn-helix domain-containing protein [Kordiimonas gwangyangensis]|uniref:helix-turn-helix domain-containing protein n=1 Tax=Kordiimonas gwangyangensis TaxID=288022 RepID=UPI000368905D|nr:helix-turn-helix domain-containing protein [Kordiimonas gwangyangensis]
MDHQLVRSAKDIGIALRRRRRKHNLTQAALAQRAGLRQSTVSQVENGLETVKLSTIIELMRVLDLEIQLQPRSKSTPQDIEDLF